MSFKLNLNFRKKGILFVVIVITVAVSINLYAASHQTRLKKQFNELSVLRVKSDLLQKAQLSAFNSVTDLLIFFQAESRKTTIELTHEKFLDLLANYNQIIEQFPEQKEKFKAFLQSLAMSVSKPTPKALSELASHLSLFHTAISSLQLKVMNERKNLEKQYTEGLQTLVVEMLLLGLASIVFIALVVFVFMRRITGDIYTLNFALGRTLDSSSNPFKHELNRSDELQLLAVKISELFHQLKQREQSLNIEQRHRSHREQNLALEHLTQGLVHAIGNPAAGLSGLIQQLLQDEAIVDINTRSLLKTMESSVARILSINEDLKHFSERTGNQRELLDLNQMISEQIRLLNYDEKWYGVTLEMATVVNIPAIFCSRDDISLIFDNLLENVLDAFKISDKNKHKLRLETFVNDDTSAGFVVTDNANGMDVEVKQNALNAFFSTKTEHSSGVGMGLLSALSMVEKYSGKLSIASKPEVGTSVTVVLPTLSEQPAQNMYTSPDNLQKNLLIEKTIVAGES